MLSNLAYPVTNAIHTVPNPHLAYTGRGGAGGNIARAYPSPGIPAGGFNFLNPLSGQQGGSGGSASYPNGLAGQPWTANANTWPGVDGIAGNRNYYPMNNYHTDVQLAIKDVGANRPFLSGGGRRRRRRSGRGTRTMRRRRTRRGIRGGAASNLPFQDITNVARLAQSGVVGAYDGLMGQRGPVSPLPWKDQY